MTGADWKVCFKQALAAADYSVACTNFHTRHTAVRSCQQVPATFG